jgi:hypothetical protein
MKQSLNTLFFLFFLFCIPDHLFSQSPVDIYINQSSKIPEDARYEIVQSTINARGTFKLDRFTGKVYQFVMNEDSTNRWQEIPRTFNPKDGATVKGKPNYQLFLSGLTRRFDFLLNVRTGATWEIMVDENGNESWEPIK